MSGEESLEEIAHLRRRVGSKLDLFMGKVPKGLKSR